MKLPQQLRNYLVPVGNCFGGVAERAKRVILASDLNSYSIEYATRFATGFLINITREGLCTQPFTTTIESIEGSIGLAEIYPPVIQFVPVDMVDMPPHEVFPGHEYKRCAMHSYLYPGPQSKFAIPSRPYPPGLFSGFIHFAGMVGRKSKFAGIRVIPVPFKKFNIVNFLGLSHLSCSYVVRDIRIPQMAWVS